MAFVHLLGRLQFINERFIYSEMSTQTLKCSVKIPYRPQLSPFLFPPFTIKIFHGDPLIPKWTD